MSSRAQQREELDRAHEIQTTAAMHGALRFTAVGIGLVTIAHYSWPLFRRQTLPFKTFLVSAFTMYGLVLGADNALLAHEAERRKQDGAIRRQARLELARKGLIGTETEIAKWRAEHEAALAQANQDQQAP
ncbi:hypothetical protein HGRIS_009654 [Hohenbuehelia grisea]|uniref:Uncharacterized protein n=1 Tax=Hohenbuehelia grisea TaxID=104357 RepID=A0ABR3J1Y0_9AGAR